MGNYPDYSFIGNEILGAPIGDNKLTQGLGFPLRPVQEPAAGPASVLVAESTATQAPAGTGESNAIQVEFGTAQGSGADPLQIDALGNLTFNEAGFYAVVMTIYVVRAGPAGVANFVIRGLIDDLQFGNPVLIQMTDADNTALQQLSFSGQVTPGQVLTMEAMRDPTGNNDGSLGAFTTTSWGTAPSAIIRVTKF